MEVEGNISVTGAPTATALIVNLPGGYTIDTTKISNVVAERAQLGTATVLDVSATWYVTSKVSYNSTTAVAIMGPKPAASPNEAQAITHVSPMTWASGDQVMFRFSVPITGWSSGQLLSSDSDTRVVSAHAYLSAAQSGFNPNASGVKINIDSVTPLSGMGGDTHGGFDTVNKRYVVKVPGDYWVSARADFGGTNVLNDRYILFVAKNGTLVFRGTELTPAAANVVALTGSAKISLVAGDYLEVFITGVGNNSVNTLTINSGPAVTYLSIVKASGPSQIAASESVSARYSTAAAQSIPNGGLPTTIDFGTKTYDSHGSVSTGANFKFTAPVSGKYSYAVTATFAAGGGWAAAEYTELIVRKNGSSYSNGLSMQTSTHTSQVQVQSSGTVQLLAGEYIDAGIFQNSGGPLALAASANYNFFSVDRIGNF
jgi:hypothetical protein